MVVDGENAVEALPACPTCGATTPWPDRLDDGALRSDGFHTIQHGYMHMLAAVEATISGIVEAAGGSNIVTGSPLDRARTLIGELHAVGIYVVQRDMAEMRENMAYDRGRWTGTRNGRRVWRRLAYAAVVALALSVASLIALVITLIATH